MQLLSIIDSLRGATLPARGFLGGRQGLDPVAHYLRTKAGRGGGGGEGRIREKPGNYCRDSREHIALVHAVETLLNGSLMLMLLMLLMRFRG